MASIALRTDKLTKRYGSLVAVKDLSLEVYEGEVFGFLGPNGAGKTTSIQMMCGLLKPDAGRVFIREELAANGSSGLRVKVGMCPQNVILWERLTCLEQLEFLGQMYGLPRKLARQRGLRLLEEMDLASRRDEQARRLSGGMQRRLNLAMALIHDPEIVVLDEPEAGLDPQSRILVREYLRSLAHHKTVILTTHNMDEAGRVCSRIAIIDHGELLVVGSPEALIRRLGEGDIIEITLVGGPEEREQALGALSRFCVNGASASQMPDGVALRAQNAVACLPEIMQTLSAQGFQPIDVRLRKNTLEDVFIGLTGRRLRE